jgi:hypothetical protein
LLKLGRRQAFEIPWGFDVIKNCIHSAM